MKDKVLVAFRLNGGIGTYIQELNFIQYFFDKFADSVLITVFGSEIASINYGIMEGQYFIHKFYERKIYDRTNFDLAIDLNWFPKIERVNKNKIKDFPLLTEIITRWQDFANNKHTKIFLNSNPVFEANIIQYAQLNGKNRLTAMDIDGLLGISRSLKFKLQIKKNENEVLKKFSLFGKQYITMQSGVNYHANTVASPKQWSVEKYSQLCHLIHEKLPQFVCVQLGESLGGMKINDVDICLLDQTDFEDMKIILKNAFLHIDGECGMVHIRKSLTKNPSIVLYGQIPAKLHGYDDNIYITSSVCAGECAKLFSAWKTRCLISETPLCMDAISAESVLDAIKTYEQQGFVLETKETLFTQLMKEKDIELDSEWVERWLSKKNIYDFFLEKISLKNMYCTKLTENGWEKVSAFDMPQYAYLTGNEEVYSKYLDFCRQKGIFNEHTLESIEHIFFMLNKAGFDEKKRIVVDGGNHILDGAHRFAWLAWKYGTDYEIEVLKIYGDWKIM